MSSPIPDPIVFTPVAYNAWGVALSLLMAVAASYVALDLAGRVRGRGRMVTVLWTLGGAFVMGTGVWAMHFVGMLALRLSIPLGYRLDLTILSWVAGVATSGLALRIAARDELRPAMLAAGALLLGAGICAMHYIGMASLSLEPAIVWDPWLVAASVVVAVAASTAALLIFFGMRRLSGWHAAAARVVAALVMGGAVAGMHYTAMAAAGFVKGAYCGSLDGLGGSSLGSLLSLATLGLLMATMLTSLLDDRLQSNARQAKQERIARQIADAANREKTAFLARMSHELRTPLNAIHGFAELMLREAQPSAREVQQHRLELIVNSSRHLLALINDLLDVSRIELGSLDVQVQSTELVGIAQAAIAELEVLAQRRQVTLRLVHPERALWASADPLRMHQVLSNLLSNAIKYNRPNGQVTLELALIDGHACAAVSDTGIGMTTEQLGALFQPFNRLGRHDSAEGTGIGLVIAKHLVDGMGGWLEVASEAGAGSCFTVRLRAASAPQPAAPAAPQRAPIDPAEVRGTVLYVEDDLVNQLLVQSFLGLRPGVTLLLANNGSEGIAAAVQSRPDLMLVDMMLPDMRGDEIARALQLALGDAAPPMIAFSANSLAEDIDAARAAGFADYLVKPSTTQELLAMVDRHLVGQAWGFNTSARTDAVTSPQ